MLATFVSTRKRFPRDYASTGYGDSWSLTNYMVIAMLSELLRTDQRIVKNSDDIPDPARNYQFANDVLDRVSSVFKIRGRGKN